MSRRRKYLAGALTVAFVLLTVAVHGRTPVVRLDTWVWHLSLRLRFDPLVSVARFITATFSPPATLGALLLVATVISLRRASMRPLVWAGTGAAVMATLVRGVKLTLARPGPGSLDADKFNGAYPSGHTASLIVCGGAIVLLLGLRHVRAAWLTFGGILILVVTCLLYAHQHWVSDIVGSALIASALMLWLASWLPPEPCPVHQRRARRVLTAPGPVRGQKPSESP